LLIFAVCVFGFTVDRRYPSSLLADPMRTLVAALLLLFTTAPSGAHPSILECNGLSTRLAANATIMTFPIQQAPPGQAPFTIKRAKPHHGRGAWTNYTINGRMGEVLVELLPGDRNATITSFPTAPLCGSGDGGLCPTAGCSSQLYAMMGDCTGEDTCLFGVASQPVVDPAARSDTLLLAWGLGGTVTYARVNLSTIV